MVATSPVLQPAVVGERLGRAVVVVVGSTRSTGPAPAARRDARRPTACSSVDARAARCGPRRRAAAGPRWCAGRPCPRRRAPAASVDLMWPTDATGRVSVMPHACSDRQADLLAVGLRQRPGHRRAAARDGPQAEVSRPFELGQHAHPDRGHAGGDRDPLGLDQRRPAPRATGRARASPGRRRRPRGVGQAPGVGVEHRHDRQDPVAPRCARARRRSARRSVCRNVERWV